MPRPPAPAVVSGSPTVAPATPDVDTRPVTDDGDHDRFAHYVDRSEAARGYVEGTPVRALCGKVWVPTRDPDRYPVCPTCKEIAQAIFGGGEGDDAGDGAGE